MADGFLEKHYEDYEARKAAWLKKGQCHSNTKVRHKLKGTIERPDNEAL